MNRIRVIPKKIVDRYAIPYPGETKTYVSVGESVDFAQEIGESKKNKIEASYFLPKLLGVKTDKASDHVGRIGGEYVKKGDLLAERLTAAGMLGRRVVSGVDGVVSTERLKHGYLDILGEFETVTISSNIRGEVVELSLDSHIEIECEGSMIDFIKAFNLNNAILPKGDQISGELAILGKGDSVYSTKDLKESYEGMIVYSGRFLYPDLAKELYRRGAVALITYSADFDSLNNLDIPIVVLGGFGLSGVNYDILMLFSDNVSHQAKIDPANKYISVANSGGVDGSNYKGYAYFSPQINPGASVICMSPDIFGLVGKIVERVDENEGKYIVETEGRKRLVLNEDLLELYVPIV